MLTSEHYDEPGLFSATALIAARIEAVGGDANTLPATPPVNIPSPIYLHKRDERDEKDEKDDSPCTEWFMTRSTSRDDTDFTRAYLSKVLSNFYILNYYSDLPSL